MSRQILYEANGSSSVGPRSAGIAVSYGGVVSLSMARRSGKHHHDNPRRAVLSFYYNPEINNDIGDQRAKCCELFMKGWGARLMTLRPLFAIFTVRRKEASLNPVYSSGRLRAVCRRVQSPLCTVGHGPVFHTTADAGNRNEFFENL